MARSNAILIVVFTLSACATPARMHDAAQLNRVATGCGLALGELIQDEEREEAVADGSPGRRAPSSAAASRAGRAATGSRPYSSTMSFPEG